jgi:tetratricopeptide (TPR) repeat protein
MEPVDMARPAGETLDGALLDVLWDFNDPAASEERLREAAETCPPGSVAAAELATQVARALGLQGRFEEARVMLDGIRSSQPVVQARIALEQGRIRNSSGDPVGAVPFFRDAVDVARAAHDDFLLVDALHMLAIGDTDRYEAWTRQGLEVARDHADPRVRRWCGALLNNLGWSRFDRGLYEDALVAFEEALAWYRQAGTPEQVHRARWAVARCLRALGHVDEARAIQLELRDNDPSDPYVAEELAALGEDA